MRSETWLILAGFAIAGVCAPKLAHAAGDKVLVLQWPTASLGSNGAGDSVNTNLTALGYDVTLMNSVSTDVPANVASYKQVYVVSLGLTSDAGSALLVSYVQGGGHLYVTGDRPDPTNDLESMEMQEKVLKPILKNSTALQVGTGKEGGGFFVDGGLGEDLITLVPEITGVASHPNLLTQFYMGDPGIIGGVETSHIFANDQSGNPVGAVWTQADLLKGNGCVMLMEDVNWWTLATGNVPPPTPAEVLMMSANVADFMKYCGDHDLDGILDGLETPLGTDPLNPDSDGDGLCDGVVAVNDASITQKCIAGENAETKQDSDKDGKIDALDPDDDNDGITSKNEVADDIKFGDVDKDGVHAWLDLDSDDDGVSDHDEGRVHFNSAGVPDYLDPDYPTVGGGGKGNPDGGMGVGSADCGTLSGAGDSGSSGGCGCIVEPLNDASNSLLAIGLFSGLFAIGARRRRR